MSRSIVIFASLLLACGGKAADTGEPPPIPSGGYETGDGCEGADPIVTLFTAEADGLQEFEGGGTYPAITLTIDATDEDGDLSFMTYDVWWDDTPDESVDTSNSADESGQFTVSSDECGGYTANLALTIPCDGDPAENTWHDFAVRVTDRNGYESDIAIAQGGTPKSDGSDPDPAR
jgi:hypothetical protein